MSAAFKIHMHGRLESELHHSERRNRDTDGHIHKTALNRTRPGWEINRKHMSGADGHTDQRTEAAAAPQAFGQITCLLSA